MASIYKRGDNYYLDYSSSKFITPTNPQGRKRESLGKISKQEAEAKRKKIEYELAYVPTDKGKPKINFVDYANTYLIQFLLKYPNTYQTQQHTLLIDFEPIFKNYMLDEITINDITGFIGLKVGHIKNATINRKLSILRALLNQAKADGYEIPNFKIKELPDDESRPPKYFSLEELEKIYKEDNLYSHWWKFLANTGLRMGEFYNLKVEDIQNDSIYIISTSGNRTKSRKWRFVRLTDEAKASLNKFDLSKEYVLPRVHKDMPKTRLRRICKKVGIKQGKWGVHCLRHTFASHLVMDGVPIRTIQVLLGHASIQTTEQYAHLSPEYLKDSLGNLNL
jgi:integrase